MGKITHTTYLIDEVLNVRPGETGGASSQTIDVDFFGYLYFTEIVTKNLFSAAVVRDWHLNFNVESSWSKKSFVQVISAVSCSKDDDS